MSRIFARANVHTISSFLICSRSGLVLSFHNASFTLYCIMLYWCFFFFVLI